MRVVIAVVAAAASCACGVGGMAPGVVAAPLPLGPSAPGVPIPPCYAILSDVVKGYPGGLVAVARVDVLEAPGCLDDKGVPSDLVRWRVIYPEFPSPGEFDFASYASLADLAADNRLPHGSLARYTRLLQKQYHGPVCMQARTADGSHRAYIALAGMPADDCHGDNF